MVTCLPQQVQLHDLTAEQQDTYVQLLSSNESIQNASR